MKRLIKPLGLLAAVIFFCTIVVRTFTGSDSLADYARKNPEIAYAAPAGTVADSFSSPSPADGGAPTDDEAASSVGMEAGTGANTGTSTEISADIKAGTGTNTSTDAETTAGTKAGIGTETGTGTKAGVNTQAAPGRNMTDASLSSPEPVPANREFYQPDFYQEPLSESLIAAITGISYPIPEVAAELLMDPQNTGQEAALPVLNTVASEEDIAISYEQLRYLSVLHYDFNGLVQTGELICNKAIANDLLEIFYELYENGYQIEKMRLIDEYDGDDTLSMLDNNTSCFNYRTAADSGNLSKHALGLAIDINPFYNPYVYYRQDGSVYISPEGSEIYADRSQAFPYKIDDTDLSYKLFLEHGFIWGGNWNYQKDYQHFQKTLP